VTTKPLSAFAAIAAICEATDMAAESVTEADEAESPPLNNWYLSLNLRRLFLV